MGKAVETMPMIELDNISIFPGSVTHFDISGRKSIQAIEQSMSQNQSLFILSKASDDSIPVPTVGVIVEVRQILRLPNQMMRILVAGEERARIQREFETEHIHTAEVELLSDIEDKSLPEDVREAMMKSVLELLLEMVSNNPKMEKEMLRQIDGISNLSQLLDSVAAILPIPFQEKQRILEYVDLNMRYEYVMHILVRDTNIIRIKEDLQRKVREKVDKNQREYILREEMKIIRKELGEEDEESEADTFQKQLNELEASDEIKEKIGKEIQRYRHTAGNSSEATVRYSYIETLLSLPWAHKSTDNQDLKNAQEILDEDHYGLQKVKERILEYLAVRHMTQKGEAPILCLVGPPGTGKTSIAKSVARALEKEYIRVSLGGVRDEAEIRGHRRTYVGAMPGRIIQGMRQGKTANPLMLLDEIDKVGMDNRTDPSAALLELLDPEQNVHFSDHYIEIPVDMSDVLFIATANDISSIQRPLLDRMEVINISGYTSNEKMHIASDHLIKKQRQANGLKASQITIKDTAIRAIIENYTREAGVRNLERKIGELCRKAVREIYQGEKKKVTVSSRNIENYLGKPRYIIDKANEKDEIGIVRGLAWTNVGGVTLQVEVNAMPGKGTIKLTGQIGDVMKESAQAAVSYIRSVAKKYKIKETYFSEHDLHIHIPEGAVPKDGPSAGITMALAMFSVITEKAVRCDTAMTGEITLRGRVLPIGGLKEKLLAAKAAGITQVLVPERNRKDVEEMEAEILENIELRFVSQMEQVFKYALA